MKVIEAVKAFQDRATGFGQAKFPPAARVVIAGCLEQRHDPEPAGPEKWAAVLGESALEWTGFAMTTNRASLRVAASVGPGLKLFRRPKPIYWVFAGDSDAEFPDRPLSCHASLALAAEMLMIFYDGLCGL